MKTLGEIVPVGPAHTVALTSFLQAVDGADQTFLGANAAEPTVIERISRQIGGRHYVAQDRHRRVLGFSSVTIGTGWSSHVGQLRVVVDPPSRGSGLGTQLALAALAGAHESRLDKVTVEVRSDQQSVLNLFGRLGFRPEALLADHLKAPDGATYDLLTLAHRVDEVGSLLVATGLAQVRG